MPGKQEKYVRGHGNRCPQCDTPDVETTDGFDGESLSVKCNHCEATWTDTYVLTGFVDLETLDGEKLGDE